MSALHKRCHALQRTRSVGRDTRIPYISRHAFTPASVPPARADALAVLIRQHEVENDWVSTIEVLVEAKVLGLDLPSDAMESSIRTLVKGEQYQKALSVFNTLRERNHMPEHSTFMMIISALAESKQSLEALALLEDLRGAVPKHEVVPMTNVTVRALARDGHLEQALDLLNRVVVKEDMLMEYQTFNAVAVGFMKRGDQDKAEEVLEMRDYL